MLKWDKVKDVEKYEVTIEEEKSVIVTTNAYNISNLDRSKERKVDIISLNGTCRSEVSSFIIPSISPRPSVTILTRGTNLVFSNIIKVVGRHKLKYGYTRQKLDKEIIFNNEYNLYMTRGYFQIDDSIIYYNLSFLPKFCDIASKTTFKIEKGKECPKSLVFTSDPLPTGYVLNYINKDGNYILQLNQLSSNIIELGGVGKCQPQYARAIVYPFYQRDKVLCNYGEGIEVNLHI